MGLPMLEGGIWREAYDNDPAIIYALDQDLRFIRCNPAWDRFARANGKAELTELRVLGRCIMDVTPNVLRDFYSTAYDSALRFQRQWWHVFDCSSVDVQRSFQMRVSTGRRRSHPCDQHFDPRRTTRTTDRTADRGVYHCRGNRYHLCQLPPRRAPQPARQMGLGPSSSEFKRDFGSTGTLSVLFRLSLPRSNANFGARSGISLTRP